MCQKAIKYIFYSKLHLSFFLYNCVYNERQDIIPDTTNDFYVFNKKIRS